jgi:hypothetical protein
MSHRGHTRNQGPPDLRGRWVIGFRRFPGGRDRGSQTVTARRQVRGGLPATPDGQPGMVKDLGHLQGYRTTAVAGPGHRARAAAATGYGARDRYRSIAVGLAGRTHSAWPSPQWPPTTSAIRRAAHADAGDHCDCPWSPCFGWPCSMLEAAVRPAPDPNRGPTPALQPRRAAAALERPDRRDGHRRARPLPRPGSRERQLLARRHAAPAGLTGWRQTKARAA